MAPLQPSADLPFIAGRERVTHCDRAVVHAHAWPQIGLPAERALTVFVGDVLLVVPPGTAVWMPAELPHRATCLKEMDVRIVAVNPRRAPQALRFPCVLDTSAFYRELLCHMGAVDIEDRSGAYADRLLDVLVAQTRAAPAGALSLKMPQDRRLRTIATALLEDVLDERTLADWAQIVGASYRTLARHFVQETRLTYHEWRQALLAVEAIRRLGQGDSVGAVAADLGYASIAGFSAMFKRTTGRAPSSYRRCVAREG
ncbi:HTH-type transcriptional repressor of iron proteins A [Variovorax sp. SRS16]|uniref:helix-turn-helix domain-containing protein n=1 Tax=Variovorax sp. SRS16 TaxID=282217 RepID=UPI0013199368|nr:AraC family transcriptional regulator [Variovorax sp. SRS16]VTU16821.1 HTH-type transcriptional repressor of iron proteins A [Variovorax sp. SRS16]